MTVAYDLYGAKGLGLLSAKVNVERTLGEALEERDSSYQGVFIICWVGVMQRILF